jgi:hypothetical protein
LIGFENRVEKRVGTISKSILRRTTPYSHYSGGFQQSKAGQTGFSTAEWRVIRFSEVASRGFFKKLDPGFPRDDGFKWWFSILR